MSAYTEEALRAELKKWQLAHFDAEARKNTAEGGRRIAEARLAAVEAVYADRFEGSINGIVTEWIPASEIRTALDGEAP